MYDSRASWRAALSACSLHTRLQRSTVVCTLRYLALALTHLVHCARVLDYLSTLMYHSGNSARELTLSHPPPVLSDPFPSFATTSFSGGYKSRAAPRRAAPMAAGNSRNFTFESYASAALCGSSSAASGDNFGRISANLRGRN